MAVLSRRLFAAAALLALAGCSNLNKPAALPAPGTVTVRFVPGGDVDSIEVTVYDRLPLNSADLLLPGGVIEAEEIETDKAPATVNRAAAAFPPNTPGFVQRTSQSNETLSTAQIRIPDRNIYRQDWQEGSIRVQLGRSGAAQRVMILAAPRPPA